MVYDPIKILDKMLEPLVDRLSPDAAKDLVQLRADEKAQQRIEELADKCTEGLLTPDERAEYESYIEAGELMAIIQSKARKALARGRAV